MFSCMSLLLLLFWVFFYFLFFFKVGLKEPYSFPEFINELLTFFLFLLANHCAFHSVYKIHSPLNFTFDQFPQFNMPQSLKVSFYSLLSFHKKSVLWFLSAHPCFTFFHSIILLHYFNSKWKNIYPVILIPLSNYIKYQYPNSSFQNIVYS